VIAWVSAAGLVIAAIGGCGGDEREPAHGGAASVDLVITVTSPQGTRETALECDASARSQRCETARRLAGFLAKQPPRDRVCTQIFGGPETAHVRGTIGDRRIDRRFSKTNGCEIADWQRAEALLAPA
jgi:hypothetical protein